MGSAEADVPQAARIMLASTKIANTTYEFLRIFSLLLIEFFIRCHLINRLLMAMEEWVNIWLIKKALKALGTFRACFS
jgi:hypothetical protein